MRRLRLWFGTRCRCSSGSPVLGLVEWCRSQRSIAARQYVWPSAAITGTRMSARVIGHVNSSRSSCPGSSGTSVTPRRASGLGGTVSRRAAAIFYTAAPPRSSVPDTFRLRNSGLDVLLRNYNSTMTVSAPPRVLSRASLPLHARALSSLRAARRSSTTA